MNDLARKIADDITGRVYVYEHEEGPRRRINLDALAALIIPHLAQHAAQADELRKACEAEYVKPYLGRDTDGVFAMRHAHDLLNDAGYRATARAVGKMADAIESALRAPSTQATSTQGSDARDEALISLSRTFECKHRDRYRLPDGKCSDCGKMVGKLPSPPASEAPAPSPTQETCPACKGNGFNYQGGTAKNCEACRGTGKLTPTQEGMVAELNLREIAALKAKAGTGEEPQHVCGLTGFGALGDVCPACRKWTEEVEAKAGTNAGQGTDATPAPGTGTLKYIPTPLTYKDDGYNGGPAILDAKGGLVAALFWPGHPPEEEAEAVAEVENLWRGWCSHQPAQDAERVAKNGVSLIAAERQRQITAEEWTPEHDDEHTQSEMAMAAAAYATPESRRWYVGPLGQEHPVAWPWDYSYWKPCPNNRIRELVKAGALIAAEIDRLQRVAADAIGGADALAAKGGEVKP